MDCSRIYRLLLIVLCLSVLVVAVSGFPIDLVLWLWVLISFIAITSQYLTTRQAVGLNLLNEWIDNSELSLVYQPIIKSGCGSVVGAEVLTRFEKDKHTERVIGHLEKDLLCEHRLFEWQCRQRSI